MTKEAHFSSEFKETALFAPPSLLERLEQLDSLDASRHRKKALGGEIARLSEAYTRSRSELREASSSPGGLRARLRFFLPRDLPKAAKPLLEAAARGLLPKGDRLRVLDLGAGLGTTSLSLLRVLHLKSDTRPVEIVAVDQDAAALEKARALLSRPIEGFAAPAEVRVEAMDLSERSLGAIAKGERFHLILIGLALNELSDEGQNENKMAELIEELAMKLVDGGLILIVEPALKETSRALMSLRDAVAEAGALEILGPCMHHAPCPMLERKRDWCHDSLSGEHPDAIAALAEAAGLRAARPTFSWLLLRRSEHRLTPANLEEAGSEDATKAEDEILSGRIISHRLPSKGKLELQLCSTQGELITLRRLDRHRAEANAEFDELARGDRVKAIGERKKQALSIMKDSEITRL